MFWRRINGTFLLVLLAGIVTSLLSLARAAQFALAHYPLLIWSFFFGLILASIFYVSRQQRLWRAREWTGLVLGTAVALASALTPPLDLGTGTLTLLGAGMLAICAMILPGVSGSFILLMLGLYPVVINAMSGLDPSVLVPFAVGAIVGLLLFSNLLSWLLHHHHSTTLSVLTGFLVGSLAAVWPWKIGGAATAPELLTPGAYAVLVGDPRLVACAAATATGLVLVLALEYLGGNGLRRPEKSI